MNGAQKFQIHRDDRSTDRLPSAHTCFNQLDLPAYEVRKKSKYIIFRASNISSIFRRTTSCGPISWKLFKSDQKVLDLPKNILSCVGVGPFLTVNLLRYEQSKVSRDLMCACVWWYSCRQVSSTTKRYYPSRCQEMSALLWLRWTKSVKKKYRNYRITFS